ncbi:MAG: HDOD domain-containing protein [Acidimicrobiia bacterium]|nr:HDOD domain-containing protein [Acidimicrobiia bacterium]
MSAVLTDVPETKPWALRELPAFPSITTKLLQLLSSSDTQVNKLVDLLRSDAALSAELLRRANSALYGFRSQVGSLQHAVMLLGFDQMKSLAMAVSMGAYLKSALRIAALRRCWRHSLATALVAEQLARHMKLDPDGAYTAGLLHDIGLLGLMVNYPEAYSEMLVVGSENAFDIRTVERAQFDVDHCEAGAWLAQQWNFPEEIQQAAARHHEKPADDHSSLTACIYWSSRLADALGFLVNPTPDLHAYADLREIMPGGKAIPENPSEWKTSIGAKVDGFE